jgi:Protein of unknown function (DUF3108)
MPTAAATGPGSSNIPAGIATSRRPSTAARITSKDRPVNGWVRFQRLARHLGRTARSIIMLPALLATAQAADPDRLEMRIEMFGTAGLHVATNHTIVEETTGRYAITTDVESRGVGALFVELTSHSEVRGRLTGTALHPQAYLGEVHRNGVISRSRVDYATDGTVTAESIPLPETRTPVTAPLMRGTVDQLTAFLMIERQLAARGSCALTISVFDGRRRYDLHFDDAGPDGAHSFASLHTQACRMRREAMAGFRDESGRTEGAYAGTLWFARLVQGDMLIPLEMEFSTEFGTVTGQLAEVRGRGVHLQFAK